jgi:predicted secreted protein
MKKLLRTVFLAGILLALLHPSAFAQETWARTYGGGGADNASSIQQTTDSGFVVAGNTQSFGAGSYDFWVLKLNASGNVQWQKTYGGATTTEIANSIQQTTDGGFAVAGRTFPSPAGGNDFWVLKLDASGNVQWQKTYGDALSEIANSIRQTTDGGFVVAGYTDSFGAGLSDFWVLKLDASGNVTWQKTYGGASGENADSIQQTADGGFVVAGTTQSFGASGDFWVLKLDASGNRTAASSWRESRDPSARALVISGS